MDAVELARKVYSWVNTCRRETAIDPDPANFELVMHLDTWREVLKTIPVYYDLPTAEVYLGFKVRIDTDLPLGQVKLRSIWEVTL